MRMEIAGAQVTAAMVDVIEELQTNTELLKLYTDTLDDLTRKVVLDIDSIDENDSAVLGIIRVLQMIRRDIITIANPPDADDPENDIPVVSI